MLLKRALTFVLAFAMVCGLLAGLPGSTGIYSGKTRDNIMWTLNANTSVLTFTCTRARAMWGNDAPWRAHIESITSVVISDWITTIGDRTFLGASNLRNVDMPRVTTIGERAFQGVTSLTSVYMPNVTRIGSRAFLGASSLRSVYMPNVTRIGNQAFEGASNLRNVDIPASITYIGWGAFRGTSSFTSATIHSREAIFGVGGLYYVFQDTHPDFVIHGFTGSTAEAYAISNGHNFVPSDD